MKYFNRRVIVIVAIASLLISGCGAGVSETTTEEGPAQVEHLEGAEPTRVTLTEDAAKRLDIQTVAVRGNGERIVIPYAAILYDTEGNTWIYTNPEPLIFVRSPITVDRIEGEEAFLSAGPPSGTAVVTVGATELFGSESEFEEE
jgi:uncharacterized protein YceK